MECPNGRAQWIIVTTQAEFFRMQPDLVATSDHVASGSPTAAAMLCGWCRRPSWAHPVEPASGAVRLIASLTRGPAAKTTGQHRAGMRIDVGDCGVTRVRYGNAATWRSRQKRALRSGDPAPSARRSPTVDECVSTDDAGRRRPGIGCLDCGFFQARCFEPAVRQIPGGHASRPSPHPRCQRVVENDRCTCATSRHDQSSTPLSRSNEGSE